jgi:hypothetical protein
VLCFASGLFAAFQPKAFLRQIADSPSEDVVSNDLTIFMTRLFGITTAALGASLFLMFPELKRSTRNKLLACMFLGDSAQIYFTYTQPKPFGGVAAPKALSKSSTLSWLNDPVLTCARSAILHRRRSGAHSTCCPLRRRVSGVAKISYSLVKPTWRRVLKMKRSRRRGLK